MADNVTSAIGAAGAAAPRDRVRNRAILRVSIVAGTWGALLCWFLLVVTGNSVTEASHTLFWLLRILCFYLGALALWVIYNKTLFAVRGASKVQEGERRTFDKDYFGRPVHVAEGADLQFDQHIVLAYEDGRKVYRAPKEEEAPAVQEPAVAAGVKALAAAAGAAPSSSSSASEQVAPSEAHAGDL